MWKSISRRIRVIPHFKRTKIEGCQASRRIPINHKFKDHDRKPTRRWSDSYNHNIQSGSKVIRSRSYYRSVHNRVLQRKVTEFLRGFSTQWIAQNILIKEHHVLPTDDDPPSQQNLQLLRWRAWDKSPIALSRIATCNRVKTTNPEYKNTQQDLTGWNLSFPTLKDMQAINIRFLSNSTREGGVLCQKLSSYSLLVSESLFVKF